MPIQSRYIASIIFPPKDEIEQKNNHIALYLYCIDKLNDKAINILKFIKTEIQSDKNARHERDQFGREIKKCNKNTICINDPNINIDIFAKRGCSTIQTAEFLFNDKFYKK